MVNLTNYMVATTAMIIGINALDHASMEEIKSALRASNIIPSASASAYSAAAPSLLAMPLVEMEKDLHADGLIDGLLGAVGGVVSPLLGTAGNLVTGIVNPLVGPVSGAISGVAGTAGNLVNSAGNLAGGLLAPISPDLANAVSGVANTAGNAVNSVGGLANGALGAAGSAVNGLANGAVGAANGVLSTGLGAASGLANGAVDTVGGALNGVTGGLSGGLAGALSGNGGLPGGGGSFSYSSGPAKRAIYDMGGEYAELIVEPSQSNVYSAQDDIAYSASAAVPSASIAANAHASNIASASAQAAPSYARRADAPQVSEAGFGEPNPFGDFIGSMIISNLKEGIKASLSAHSGDIQNLGSLISQLNPAAGAGNAVNSIVGGAGVPDLSALFGGALPGVGIPGAGAIGKPSASGASPSASGAASAPSAPSSPPKGPLPMMAELPL